MKNAKISTASPGFVSLLAVQLLGTANDNAFKTFIMLMAAVTLPQARTAHVIALAGVCFVIPYILFSSFAGALADRFCKHKTIIALKAVELGLMAVSFLPLYFQSVPALLALMFLMGVHSALLSPVKLAILPELLESNDLSNGNGLMSMTGFGGIILGAAAAGLLLEFTHGKFYQAVPFFLAVAGLGLAASLLVGKVPAAAGSQRFELDVAGRIYSDIREVSGHRKIFLALMGSAYFWFVGAMFQMNILVYGREMMHETAAALSVFQMMVALGIGVGSVLAGRLSRNRVELGLVPVGALGLVVFSAALAFSFDSVFATGVLLFLLGLSGGLFELPLETYVQYRSPEARRGTFIAAGNIMAFTGVIVASAVLWTTDSWFKLNPAQVFIVLGAMTLAVAAYIITVLPEFLLRFIAYPVVNIAYHIETKGGGNFPPDGPVLLVSNHISFVDALLLTGACQRPIRFIMHKKFYDMPVLNWFFRMAKCIPISHSSGPREIVRSLRMAKDALANGDAVCIFIEGEISRHGQLLRFKKGYERIAEGLDAPILPVHIDGVWGRLFSFEGGRAVFKWPKRLGYPVTVSFGRAMPADTDSSTIRLAMQELGAEAFRNRLDSKLPLPLAFAEEAKRHWFRFCMADSGVRRIKMGSALTRAVVLSKILDKILPAASNVGILLPPSAAGALVNIAVSLLGKVPVNLNYTTPFENIAACARQAGLEKIIVSKKLAQARGWQVSENMVFLEDLTAGISKLEGLASAIVLFIYPMFMLRKTLLARADVPLDATAAIIFTSGSTGEPKGVMLSHANIHSNIEAAAQIYQLTPHDRLVGVLPFFHSFGYTVTLWLPLVAGFGVVYHYNPLDARTIGALARRYRATMLLGTPGFFVAYIRKIETADFKTLRLAVTGAEKLREEIALSFRDKFGIMPLEGYGCTELSPAASLNIPDVDMDGLHQTGGKPGTIGAPLPGIAMKVVNPETFEPLPADTPGLLLVKGPNVMKGYLDSAEKTSAVMRDGYYITGDIASIDEDGFVTITDRLSRFSKIAGEMVPHIKIEEKLHQLAGVIERTFVVVSLPDEKRGEKLAVLCRAIGDTDALHARLKDSGLPPLWVPARDCFFSVPELPFLGSGKIDIARARQLAAELSSPSAGWLRA
ncbi:MAG: acyl-[ACP]--phospholipid O-acyltransferase [Elusimicrobiaceae bacterium]|nr:acyl-[ACP]--phospholipid O-acyltransferase [Elusimicrobiaceae bacterium]